MEAQDLSAKFKQHNIIYAALGVGQLMAMLVLYYVRDNSMIADDTLVLTFQIMVASVMAGGIGAGYFLYNQRVNATPSDASIDQKFMSYRTACLIQWALCEGPSLFSAVAYFNTGHATFLLFFGISLMFYLVKLRPSLENFKRDFKL